MKKIVIIIAFLFSVSVSAQSDLYKLKQDFISCNEYGVILTDVNIEMTYSDSSSFTVPYAVFIREVGFSRRYKILVASNIESKKEAVEQSLKSIIDYEARI